MFDVNRTLVLCTNDTARETIDWRSVSPKGQCCSADQDPLKRSDLDDFVALVRCRVRCLSGSEEDFGWGQPTLHPACEKDGEKKWGSVNKSRQNGGSRRAGVASINGRLP